MKLIPCARCRRHVGAHERSCPFCRLTPLAAVALIGAAVAVGCSHDEHPATSPTAATTTEPSTTTTPPVATTEPSTTPSTSDAPQPSTPPTAIAMYGVPPKMPPSSK